MSNEATREAESILTAAKEQLAKRQDMVWGVIPPHLYRRSWRETSSKGFEMEDILVLKGNPEELQERIALLRAAQAQLLSHAEYPRLGVVMEKGDESPLRRELNFSPVKIIDGIGRLHSPTEDITEDPLIVFALDRQIYRSDYQRARDMLLEVANEKLKQEGKKLFPPHPGSRDLDNQSLRQVLYGTVVINYPD